MIEHVSLFILSTTIPSYGCTTVFIHSPVDGHLDYLIFFSEHETQRAVKDLFGVEATQFMLWVVMNRQYPK